MRKELELKWLMESAKIDENLKSKIKEITYYLNEDDHKDIFNVIECIEEKDYDSALVIFNRLDTFVRDSVINVLEYSLSLDDTLYCYK
jgi:hypothetical protein